MWSAPTSLVHRAHDLLLDDVERARAAAFVAEDARARFVLAATLLRLVAAQTLGVDPVTVNIDRTCERCQRAHGRPRVAGHDLGVSVAHSGRLAAVAVVRGIQVGVDLEQIRPIDYEPLLDDVCRTAERRGLSGPDAFFRMWTRKEAVLKATGDGLSVPMRDVLLTSVGSPPELVRYPGRPGLRMTIGDLDIDSGYAAAAAAIGDSPVQFCVRDGTQLFG